MHVQANVIGCDIEMTISKCVQKQTMNSFTLQPASTQQLSIKIFAVEHPWYMSVGKTGPSTKLSTNIILLINLPWYKEAAETRS